LHLEPGASVSLFDAVLFLGYVLRTGLYFGLYLKTGEARYERRAQQMFQYAAFFIKRDLLGGP